MTLRAIVERVIFILRDSETNRYAAELRRLRSERETSPESRGSA